MAAQKQLKNLVQKALGGSWNKDTDRRYEAGDKQSSENEDGHNVGEKKEEDQEIKPYTRDKALNEANKRRFGEKTRPDPYNNTT
jgi:hypothetical protein